MKLPNGFDLKPMNVLKIAGLALVAIIAIIFAVELIGSSFSVLLPKNYTQSIRQNMPSASTDEVYYETGGIANSKMSGDAVGLSVRNVETSAVPPKDSITIGDTAEEFEVTDYSATIETRDLKNTCAAVAGLKSRADVIFENANEYRQGCNYSFKVKRDKTEEILGIIKSLNPKEVAENTYTIKKLVDDYTGETEILAKKMASIEETLKNAVSAYDDITSLARKTQDVESLAKIIDSKINIIERLTQERINTNAQLERLNRSKAEQLDRLEYTYFNVNVMENKFVDGQNLKDSWKAAIKTFIRDINDIAQGITIGLFAMLFFALQYIIYLFIILIIAKYSWRLAKNIWQK
jgi:hypothetical protein